MDVASRTRGAKSTAVLRLALSGVFLWAFFDKLFGLGFATAGNAAWVRGGSPTEGFLTHGVDAANPFMEQFTALAGQAWVIACTLPVFSIAKWWRKNTHTWLW